MIKPWLRLVAVAALASAAAFGLARSADAGNVDVTVYSNNTTPGDFFPGGSPDQFQAVGSTNWYYANVRVDSTIGINNTIPDDYGGNGSVYFKTTNADGKSKGDISYATGQSLGLLKDLDTLSFDWYRSSASDVLNYLAPSLRIYIDNGQGSKGYLVWENSQNTLSAPVATDDWIPVNTINQMFWSTGSLPFAGQAFAHHYTLSDWLNTYLTNSDQYAITEVNAGVGSGWKGTFIGAVDNIAFGFNGDSTTYDFEVRPPAVPEPGSIVMGLIAGGLGLAGAAWRRRRVG